MDLQKHLQKLHDLGELQTVSAEVGARLELAALCRNEFRKAEGGKSLLFKRIYSRSFPVIANMFGSEKRTTLLLHSTDFVEFSLKLQTLLRTRNGNVEERLRFREKTNLVEDSKYQISEGLNLLDLPAIQSWPKEGGAYLNLALSITEHPDTGQKNLGLYRAQVVDSDHLAINFSPASGAAKHFAAAAKAKKTLPISLIMGSDPALIWVAAAPLPEECEEFAFHSALFDQTLKFTPGLTQPIAVPANAEIVIEGHLLPEVTVKEGPFGNHTGQYVCREDCPLMQVTAIRHRPGAICPTTVVGPPPSENIYLGKANEILLREMLKIDFPQIRNLKMPVETIFHGVALLSVKQQSAKENKELLHTLWERSPLRRAPLLVLLDEDINLSSLSHCWWRTINKLKNQRIYQECGRIGIDATGVNPSSLVEEDPNTRELLQRRMDEYFRC
ncbi:MAG: UbiD family decarboxylase [Desulfuromusa sp.]|jgi:4-hydroxy-3-polyprenylbenzoate decarboxylase|nr:UbiD family decarboxylase [Desulfuromusa sp.]